MIDPSVHSIIAESKLQAVEDAIRAAEQAVVLIKNRVADFERAINRCREQNATPEFALAMLEGIQRDTIGLSSNMVGLIAAQGNLHQIRGIHAVLGWDQFAEAVKPK